MFRNSHLSVSGVDNFLKNTDISSLTNDVLLYDILGCYEDSWVLAEVLDGWHREPCHTQHAHQYHKHKLTSQNHHGRILNRTNAIKVARLEDKLVLIKM
jgi:hypothetical protein